MRVLTDIPEQYKERVGNLLARISTLTTEVSAIEEQLNAVGQSVQEAGQVLQESIRELQESIIAEEAGLKTANKELSAQQSKLSIQEEKDKSLLAQLLESRRIKLAAIDLLNTELYKNLCTEAYLFRCGEFINQSELILEQFKSSTGIHPELIAEIIRLDALGEKLNAYGTEFWGVYISSDYGYLYSSVRSVFSLKSELRFSDMADANVLYDRLLEKYIKPFEAAIKHCSSVYFDFITRRFEDQQLVNHLRNSQLTKEQRTHLSMWIPNL